MLRAVCTTAALSTALGQWTGPGERADCERELACNGDLCDEICKIGTVETDPWTDFALQHQRELHFNRTYLTYMQPGTHNGGMSQDFRMGIEENDLYKILDPVFDKSEVIIANQRHTPYDQLRMGVRHVELDMYYFRWVDGVRVCHYPVCPFDFFALVQTAARRQDMEPEWECSKLGCTTSKPLVKEVMQSMRDWLDEPGNEREVITIFLDNRVPYVRSGFLLDDVEDVFEDMLFTPPDLEANDGEWPTIAEMVEANTRVVLENNRDSYVGQNDTDAVMFTPVLWSGQQFSPSSFEPFPKCTVGGQFHYPERQTRSLDGSLILGPASEVLWGGGKTDYPLETMLDMADCSITTQAMDNITPSMMQYFVWSWSKDEPSGSGADGCTVMNESGRWESESCTASHKFACVSDADELMFEWVLSEQSGVFGEARCPPGTSFTLPPEGIINSHLRAAADGEVVWVNYHQA